MRYSIFILFPLFVLSCAQKDVVNISDERSAPKVINIYPTADTLPENLLRLYVQFSHSMKAVDNLENIKLIDAEGQEVEGAIFNNVYELWDAEQKQLTLILDPTRVKTGLVAYEELGRALKPNECFQIVIERAEDIYGNRLEVPYIKEIYVTKEDKEIPNIKNWEIVAPKASSNLPLEINFLQVLDRLSLFHRLRLLNHKGQIVSGKIEVGRHEKSWRFIPKGKWEKGIYKLEVSRRLEDPCGNNLNGLFDHKIGSLKDKSEDEMVNVVFKIE